VKIRTGFVSNSSSSSFVLVVKKDAFDEWRSKSDPIIQAIADTIMRKKSVLGHECMLYETCSGDYCFENVSISDIIEKAKEMAKEQGVGVATRIAKLNNIKEEDVDDRWLNDVVSDGFYDMKYDFREYINNGRAWSHSIDW
jgi:hypothetical protein